MASFSFLCGTHPGSQRAEVGMCGCVYTARRNHSCSLLLQTIFGGLSPAPWHLEAGTRTPEVWNVRPGPSAPVCQAVANWQDPALHPGPPLTFAGPQPAVPLLFSPPAPSLTREGHPHVSGGYRPHGLQTAPVPSSTLGRRTLKAGPTLQKTGTGGGQAHRDQDGLGAHEQGVSWGPGELSGSTGTSAWLLAPERSL